MKSIHRLNSSHCIIQFVQPGHLDTTHYPQQAEANTPWTPNQSHSGRIPVHLLVHRRHFLQTILVVWGLSPEPWLCSGGTHWIVGPVLRFVQRQSQIDLFYFLSADWLAGALRLSATSCQLSSLCQWFMSWGWHSVHGKDLRIFESCLRFNLYCMFSLCRPSFN